MSKWYFSRGVKTYLSLGKYLLYGVLVYGYVNAIFSGERMDPWDVFFFTIGGCVLFTSLILIIYHEYLEYKAYTSKNNKRYV